MTPPPALPDTATDDPPKWHVWRTRAVTVLPIALATVLLARAAIAAIYAKLGHPGAALDDSYIHFQYARSIAEGHPWRYQAGEPPTSGATSLLWPLLLAPFYAVGLRDEAILWPAWILSFAALGALAYEAYALAKRLAGAWCAAGAGAMVLAFGGFVWCAASGMEVVPFAWVLARTVRRAIDWAEAKPEARTSRRAWELVALAWCTALFRPEGAAAALFVGAAFALCPARPILRARLFALPALGAAFALPLALLLVTGHATSNTTVAKLMVGNPYYPKDVLYAAVAQNAHTLVATLLNGEVWSAEFLPKGGTPVAIAALAALLVMGYRKDAAWRATGILLVALLMFAPCFYITFLWNRLRYLWPFATGWLVALACLARLAGDVAAIVRPRWRALGPLACGAFVGLLASKLDWVIEDVAQSASGIDRQQVALGRWAKEKLPAAARIGVNDTGAIAYFSDRKTFDVVGLTSEGEARYWVAGVGSRLEHYERLAKTDASALPTHFIVYPEWMGTDAVLGEPLHQATVTDSTILGGQTMRAYVADWSHLGSGEAPWTKMGAAADAVDVADLESEAAHAYALLGAKDGEETAHAGLAPDGTTVLDGGRTRRTRERFVVRLPAGAPAQGVVRLEGAYGTRVRVTASEAIVGTFDVGSDDWEEHAFTVPASAAKGETTIELEAMGGAVTVYHWWFGAPAP